MQRKFLTLSLALAVAAGTSVAVAQDSSTFRAQNGMIAVGSAAGIEVLSRAGASQMDYFCGAGAFAKRRLGARPNDRVVVTRALSPSPTRANTRSVEFVLGSGEGEVTPGSILRAGQGIGKSMTVAAADNQCSQSRFLTRSGGR